ncbi:MAG: hypothetical protein ACT4QD_11915 [Acidobacteriota bacterium]
MNRRLFATVTVIGFACATVAEAQFRRGILSESTEITLSPIDRPAVLLPPGDVQVEVRNASGAPARIADRLHDLLARQLTDNDSRLRVVDTGAAVIVQATLTEWKESRRNSTKYVSERRQVGTRQVTDKSGKTRTEPVYEYGRNRPSVVIDAGAGLRIEVRQASRALADETVRHLINEEHIADEGPPSRDAVEDAILDRIVQKGAGRISPGRQPVRVLLARSDEVDRLNSLAESRRWHDWLTALEAVKPHTDRRRDAYRLHNLAVAHEAVAYESATAEDWTARLGLAVKLIAQASAQNANEKYITESGDRIARNAEGYAQLAELYRVIAAAPADTASARGPAIPAATPAMTNQDVIDLRAAGLDDANLMAAIKDAKAVRFDLSPAGLKALLTAKVSNQVISAMRDRN